jgi:hypothetical protein
VVCSVGIRSEPPSNIAAIVLSTKVNTLVTIDSLFQREKDTLSRRHGGRVNEVARVLYPSIKWAEELDSFKAEAQSSSNSNKSAVSFVITRHPFYRLVSAYRDKLERYVARIMHRDYYYGVSTLRAITATFFLISPLQINRNMSFNMLCILQYQ